MDDYKKELDHAFLQMQLSCEAIIFMERVIPTPQIGLEFEILLKSTSSTSWVTFNAVNNVLSGLKWCEGIMSGEECWHLANLWKYANAFEMNDLRYQGVDTIGERSKDISFWRLEN